MERRENPQAALELLLLTTLAAGPNHGFGVHIEKTSAKLLRVEEGSPYPALHRLEKAGIVDAAWPVTPNGRRARVYPHQGRPEASRGDRSELVWRFTIG